MHIVYGIKGDKVWYGNAGILSARFSSNFLLF